MSLLQTHLGIVLVYFVYGLAFFSMGIVLTLEAGRGPGLAERRVLRPLAVFGLLHGVHEWMEIYILQARWLGMDLPVEVEWFRVVWLAVSFIPLVVFGFLVLTPTGQVQFPELYISAALFGLFFIFSLLFSSLQAGFIDVMVRYGLAIPGGILAWLALDLRSRAVYAEGRDNLAIRFRWAGIGFGLYGLTQIFVPPVDFFPANLINHTLFLEMTGMPVQVFRAATAVFVMINLLRAVEIVDRERNAALGRAQEARLEALERVQEEMVAREALRGELLRHIVTAQEEERARISRELHDETSQILTAFSLDLATLRSKLTKRDENGEIIDRLQSLSRQMSQGLYHLVHDLRPAQLDDLGLVAALEHLGDIAQQRMGLDVTIEVSGERQRLDPLIETVIFRIAQEALTNVSRHAETDQALVKLVFSPDAIRLSVEDPGVGFDPQPDLTLPHRWGIIGMRERAESVGGRLEIISAPGKGAVVSISIPYLKAAPDLSHKNTIS
jgi:signal transduction histidine kinase